MGSSDSESSVESEVFDVFFHTDRLLSSFGDIAISLRDFKKYSEQLRFYERLWATRGVEREGVLSGSQMPDCVWVRVYKKLECCASFVAKAQGLYTSARSECFYHLLHCHLNVDDLSRIAAMEQIDGGWDFIKVNSQLI